MATALKITSCSPSLIGQYPSSPVTLVLNGTNFPLNETNPTILLSTSASIANPNPFILLTRVSVNSAQTQLTCTYEAQNTSSSIILNQNYFVYYRGASPNQNRVSTTAILKFNVPTYTLISPSLSTLDKTATTSFTVSGTNLMQQAATTRTSYLVLNKNLPLDSSKILLTLSTITDPMVMPVTYNGNAQEGTYYITFDNGLGTVFSTDTVVIKATSATIIETITPTTLLKQVGKTFDITLLAGSPAPTELPTSAFLTVATESMMSAASLSFTVINAMDYTNLRCTLTSPLPATGGTYYVTLIYPTGQVADNVVYSGTNFINVVTPLITSVSPSMSTSGINPTNLTITLEIDTPVGPPPISPISAFLTNDPYSTTPSSNGQLTVTSVSSDSLTITATTDPFLNEGQTYTYYVTLQYSGVNNYVFANETNTNATFTQLPDSSNQPFASMEITSITPSTQPIKGGQILLTLANIDNLTNPFPPNSAPTLAYLISDRYPLQTGGLLVPNGNLTYVTGENTETLTFSLDPNVPSGSFYIVLEYGTNPSVVYAFSFDNTITIPPICFKENTKISCLKDNKEIDIFIQNLKKGDLVKTFKNGYLPVNVVGKSNCYNPKNTNRMKSRLYKLSKDKYPELTEDLVVTGCHSILVDYISSDKKEQIKSEMGRLYVTDNKYRMPAFLDERSDIYTEEYGDIDVYHVALGDDESRNYGIYANGLLVESCFIPRVKNEMIVIS